MSRVVGYLWSRPSSGQTPEEIEADKQVIADCCRTQQLEVSEFLIDSCPQDAAFDRPAIKRLLDEAALTVIVRSLSCFGRRFHDAATILSEFSFRSIRFISVDENIDTARPEGQQLLRMLVTIPQLRYCARPATPGSSPRAFFRSREVLHNGGACPYGYSLKESTNQFVVDEKESAVIKRIFKERALGRSLRQIANGLAHEAIATKRGGRWQANTVKTILENPFYTGDYHRQGRIHKDDHEAVIERSLFEEVNRAETILQVQ